MMKMDHSTVAKFYRQICLIVHNKLHYNSRKVKVKVTQSWAWCTGKTQRDQVEREVGGGIGIGNTCKSMADSCQCMTKTTTIL